MVTTSYPAVSRGQRRHLHGADRRVGRRARARGPRRRALASARRARAARKRRPLSFLQVRAAPVAERLRLRGGDARGRAAARRGVRRRRRWRSRPAGSPRCASRAGTARRSCTDTGWSRADSPPRPRRRRGRWSSAFTDPTSTSPRRSRPRGARRGWFSTRRRRHRLQRRSRAAGDRRSAPIPRQLEVVPYGVDADRFRPQPEQRASLRAQLGVAERHAPRVLRRAARPQEGIRVPDRRVGRSCAVKRRVLAIAGDGDLRDELRERARAGRRRPIASASSAICRRTTSPGTSRRPTSS